MAEHGLSVDPYTRLLVAVALTQELAVRQPVAASERATAQILALRAGCSVSQAARGLAALRNAGCLLAEDGERLLSPTLAIWGCVVDDPLALDERVVQAQYRVAQADCEFVGEVEFAAAFRAVAGRDPDPPRASEHAGERRLPRSAVKASVTTAVRNVHGTLAAAGIDPAAGLRKQILEALVWAWTDQPQARPIRQLADEVADVGAPPEFVQAVLRALLRAGAVVTDGADDPELDRLVTRIEGDVAALERACRATYRACVEQVRPGLLDTPGGAQAFERVLTEPPPLAPGAILGALRARGVDPEPKVRSAIVAQIARAVARDAPLNLAALVDRTTESLPVAWAQTRTVVTALLRSGVLLTADRDGAMVVTGLRYTRPDEIDERLADFYVAAVLDAFPQSRADARSATRIRRAINASSSAEGRKPRSPLDAALRELRCLVDHDERNALLIFVRDALDEVSDAGTPPGDLRRLLMRRAGYSSNVANAHLLSLARARLLRTVEGEVPTFVGAQARYVAIAVDDLAEAEKRLVSFWVDQLEQRAPSADRTAIRARFA